MSWPVVVGVAAGFVGGVNIGVLLMVALQNGKRQDRAYDEAVLLARIEDLERALAHQAERAGPTTSLGLVSIIDEPPAATSAGDRHVAAPVTDESPERVSTG